MPILQTILLAVIRTITGMLLALLTDKFVKAVIIDALQLIVNKTANEWDNKLLAHAREVWEGKPDA